MVNHSKVANSANLEAIPFTIVACIKPVKVQYLDHITVRKNPLVFNPYDITMLENLMLLRNKTDCRIICLSLGVKETAYMLNLCMALGADEAILLNDDLFAGADTYMTSFLLAKAIRKIGEINLITCGKKSVDGETGQVPIGLATRLNIQYYPHVIDIVNIDQDNLLINEENALQKVLLQLQCPAVCIYEIFSINEPNISLADIKRARRRTVTIWGHDDLDMRIGELEEQKSRTMVTDIQPLETRNMIAKIFGDERKSIYYILNAINESEGE